MLVRCYVEISQIKELLSLDSSTSINHDLLAYRAMGVITFLVVVHRFLSRRRDFQSSRAHNVSRSQVDLQYSVAKHDRIRNDYADMPQNEAPSWFHGWHCFK